MPKQKQESIRFRCSKDTFNFIEQLRQIGREGDVNPRNRSEVVRNIIQVFRLAWLTGDMDLTNLVEELKQRFESTDESIARSEDGNNESTEKD